MSWSGFVRLNDDEIQGFLLDLTIHWSCFKERNLARQFVIVCFCKISLTEISGLQLSGKIHEIRVISSFQGEISFWVFAALVFRKGPDTIKFSCAGLATAPDGSCSIFQVKWASHRKNNSCSSSNDAWCHSVQRQIHISHILPVPHILNCRYQILSAPVHRAAPCEDWMMNNTCNLRDACRFRQRLLWPHIHDEQD